MKDSYNQKFDYLITGMTRKLDLAYANILESYPEFKDHEVDTSPLLNLTLSVYVSSLTHILDTIKSNTEGEPRLMENIELSKTTLMNAIQSLPFIKKVEEI